MAEGTAGKQEVRCFIRTVGDPVWHEMMHPLATPHWHTKHEVRCGRQIEVDHSGRSIPKNLCKECATADG